MYNPLYELKDLCYTKVAKNTRYRVDFRCKILDLRINAESRMKKKNKIRILAIETSCDETSGAVVEGVDFPEIKSNIIASQIDIHKLTGGVVPEVAARAHCEAIIPVIEQALGGPIHDKIKDIDAIAVTVVPGLVGSLLVGVETAKALAMAANKPLIPINHLEGHIFAALAAKTNDELKIKNDESNKNLKNSNLELESSFKSHHSKLFPALALVVSGGHTELVLIKDMFDYEIIGQTLDDAAGEAFDKVASLLGLSYPGGPEISKLAYNYELKIKNDESSVNDELRMINNESNQNLKNSNFELESLFKNHHSSFKLPRPMLHSGDLNFSFSGLKTAVVNLVHSSQFTVDRREKNHQRTKNQELSTKVKQAIAYEFQEAVVETLLEKTTKAFQMYNAELIINNSKKIINYKLLTINSVLLTGGVSANKRLREAFQDRFGDKLLISPIELCGDNAGMIGLAGWHRLKAVHSSRLIDHGSKSSKNQEPSTMNYFPWKRVDVDPNLEL